MLIIVVYYELSLIRLRIAYKYMCVILRVFVSEVRIIEGIFFLVKSYEIRATKKQETNDQGLLYIPK